MLIRSAVSTLILLLFLTPTLGGTGEPGPRDDATLGDLALFLAVEIGLGQAESPEAAIESLAAAGVQLKGAASDRLREEALISALNQIGLHLTTSRSDRPVERRQLRGLLPPLVAQAGYVPPPAGADVLGAEPATQPAGKPAGGMTEQEAVEEGEMLEEPPLSIEEDLPEEDG